MPRTEEHFTQLARLLSLERDAERSRLAEEKASLPLGELEARGRVFLDLEASTSRTGLGGRTLVSCKRFDGRPLPALPANGDLVSVSPRRSDVDGPPSAVVTMARSRELELAFDKPPPPFVFEGRLKLELMANDVTYERARKALLGVAALDKGKVRHTREVLLGREAPTFDTVREVTPARPLNPEQRLALARALAAEDFYLVHGPPGTGKSTVLAELALALVRQGKTLLCTAASNAAVDHLLALCLDAGLKAVRLGHPARVAAALQPWSLDVLVEEHVDRQVSKELFEEAWELKGYAFKQRARGRSRERFSNAREAQAEARRLTDEARALERRAVQAVLDGAQVLCATLSMLSTRHLEGRSFDVALLDEATQAIEPLSLGAFLKAPKVVLAGDPQQLPPTVLSTQAAKEGLGRSLFERLLEEHGEGVKTMLREQHRFNAELMEFPSQQMYGGQLRAHPAVVGRRLAEVLPAGAALEAPPLLFIDTAGRGFDEEQEAGTGSLTNPGELGLVVERARALLAAGLDAAELAVITPYRAQASRLREALQDVPLLEVDTVDGFQGREKDAVLLSLVRANTAQQVGFLADVRRMNVAMTRARRHLFVVGDSGTLSGHPFYARFIEHAQATGAWRSAWDWAPPPG